MFPGAHESETLTSIHGKPFYLGLYEPGLIKALRSIPDAEVPDLPAIIDDYASRAASEPPGDLSRDLAFFDDFYFAVNDDPARRSLLHALKKQ